MAVTTMRVYEYMVECDACGIMEIYHTGDEDRGIRIHSAESAVRGAGFHRRHGELLCGICTEKHDSEKKGRRHNYKTMKEIKGRAKA